MEVAPIIGMGLWVLLLGVLTAPVATAVAADADLIERGRYLTHDVAMCVQCHTPRAEDGTLLRDQEFMGGTFPVAPPAFMDDGQWCLVTPRIVGLPGFTEEEGIQFFMTGARMGKHQPKWPMPPFQMNHEDAAAVVAYLRSLGGLDSGTARPTGTPEKENAPTAR
jgi:mono/diheme cytochrome c family protein